MNVRLRRGGLSSAQKLILAALGVCVLFVLADVPVLAEYLFARGITRALSGALSLVSALFPFSLYELIAVGLIVCFAALAAFAVLYAAGRRTDALRRLFVRVCAVLLGVLAAFAVLYAPLYARSSAAEALGLDVTEATQEQVDAAASSCVEALNALSARIERDGNGDVLCPYTFSELDALIEGEFSSCGGYFSPYRVRAKAVALSVPMSYLGITGIYFPFVAEANVNVNIPACDLPVTMAHEMSHAKGVGREDEANIVAYALCLNADDDYLNYCALLDAATVLLNSLPRECAEELYARLDEAVRQEYSRAAAHYAAYEGPIDALSSFFNDLFLKANGVASGTRSYGETVNALVALIGARGE